MLFVGSSYRLNFLVLLSEFQESRAVILFPFCTVLKRFCDPLCFPVFFCFLSKGKGCHWQQDSTTEKQSEQESGTLIAVLNSMKASIDSGNSLLQELVSHEQWPPNNETKTSKRRKSCTASLKANAVSSDKDETDVSERATTHPHHDASEADALRLFGGGDINEIVDTILEDMEDGDSDNVCCLQSALSWVVRRTQVCQLQVALLS